MTPAPAPLGDPPTTHATADHAGTVTRRTAARRTAAALRSALALVAADPVARSLARVTSPDPDPDGDLATWLYGPWWCGGAADSPAGTASATPGDDGAAGSESDARHVAVLEEMRRTAAGTTAGMLVLATAPDHLVVVPVPGRSPGVDSARTVVPRAVPVDVVVGSSRPGRPPRPGDLVEVLAGWSGVEPGAGWWWARGTAGPPRGTAEPQDRVYLHVDRLGAGPALAAVLRTAASAAVDVSLKCPASPRAYHRRDALVVYHDRSDRDRVDALLPGLAAELDPWLLPGSPPLTHPVADGIAWAQDPGGGVSLGQLRCAQVAAVVAGALGTRAPADGDGAPPAGPPHRSPAPDVTDDDLLHAATRVGIDPAAPHRVEAGS